MGKHTFFVQLALTAIWVLLMEELSWQTIAIGMLVSMLALHFCGKFLPYEEIKNINFFKLITYPFYLVGQIYVAGFSVMRIIFKGSVIGIVTIKTNLKEEPLRIILADSITLTPGSILLELENQDLTLLWVRDKYTPGDSETASKMLKSGLERKLAKAEK